MELRRLLAGEEGDVILKRVVMVLVIVVVVIFIAAEVGPIVWYKITSIQDAEDIANAAARKYEVSTGDPNARALAAFEDAESMLYGMNYSEEELKGCRIEFLPQGNVQKTKVRVTVYREAKTLLTRHIGFLKNLSEIKTTREVTIRTDV